MRESKRSRPLRFGSRELFVWELVCSGDPGLLESGGWDWRDDSTSAVWSAWEDIEELRVFNGFDRRLVMSSGSTEIWEGSSRKGEVERERDSSTASGNKSTSRLLLVEETSVVKAVGADDWDLDELDELIEARLSLSGVELSLLVESNWKSSVDTEIGEDRGLEYAIWAWGLRLFWQTDWIEESSFVVWSPDWFRGWSTESKDWFWSPCMIGALPGAEEVGEGLRLPSGSSASSWSCSTAVFPFRGTIS